MIHRWNLLTLQLGSRHLHATLDRPSWLRAVSPWALLLNLPLGARSQPVLDILPRLSIRSPCGPCGTSRWPGAYLTFVTFKLLAAQSGSGPCISTTSHLYGPTRSVTSITPTSRRGARTSWPFPTRGASTDSSCATPLTTMSSVARALSALSHLSAGRCRSSASMWEDCWTCPTRTSGRRPCSLGSTRRSPGLPSTMPTGTLGVSNRSALGLPGATGYSLGLATLTRNALGLPTLTSSLRFPSPMPFAALVVLSSSSAASVAHAVHPPRLSWPMRTSERGPYSLVRPRPCPDQAALAACTGPLGPQARVLVLGVPGHALG